MSTRVDHTTAVVPATFAATLTSAFAKTGLPPPQVLMQRMIPQTDCKTDKLEVRAKVIASGKPTNVSPLAADASPLSSSHREAVMTNLKFFWEKWDEKKLLNVGAFLSKLNELNYQLVDDAKKLKMAIEALETPNLNENAIATVKENVLKQIEKILSIPQKDTKVNHGTPEQWKTIQEHLNDLTGLLSNKATYDAIISAAKLVICHSHPKLWLFHMAFHFYTKTTSEEPHLEALRTASEFLLQYFKTPRKTDEHSALPKTNSNEDERKSAPTPAPAPAAASDEAKLLEVSKISTTNVYNESTPDHTPTSAMAASAGTGIDQKSQEPKQNCCCSVAVISIALVIVARAALPIVQHYYCPDLTVSLTKV